nr:cytochrome (ubi)quinol oxidase subunit III [Bacilli bacterium]
MAVDAHHAGHAVDHSKPLELSTEEGELKILGFWFFLAQDMILFACLFATYIIMHNHTAGGPTSMQLFDVPGFVAETLILLTSSFTYGLATFEMRRNRLKGMITWMVITALLGMSFVGLEVNEFIHYATTGAMISRSGFLSAFFTLVGTHGAHVTLGIFWMISIMVQLYKKGLNPVTARKAFIVGLYWHFLDIVWVFIFSVVYLPGVMK